ncbi:MAG: type IV secretory system conjugative DNA transfer family protein, partial [Pirellulales bacterium]
QSNSEGTSTSSGKTHSNTDGASQTATHGNSRTSASGRSETVHRRPLIQPDEVGRSFARIDDSSHPAYPGLALVIVTGANPLVVKRAHYFDDPQFIDCFSPHPDHAFLPAVPHSVDGIRPLIDTLERATNGRRLTIARWLIHAGDVTIPGQPAAVIERVPPDDRTVYIPVPYFGKVSETAPKNRLPSGEYAIPDGAALFTIKTRNGEAPAFNPLHELREACAALEKLNQRTAVPPPRVAAPSPIPKFPLVTKHSNRWLTKRRALVALSWPAEIGILVGLGAFSDAHSISFWLLFPLAIPLVACVNSILTKAGLRVKCPNCRTVLKMPKLKNYFPDIFFEVSWSGIVNCPKCGTKMDEWGRVSRS